MTPPPVIAAILALTLPGLAAGPTDDAVRDAVRRYRESPIAAAEAGRVPAAENERLVAEALGDLKLAEMTAAQLAVLYRSRMLTWGERRDAAIARLAEFSGDRSVTGASAAVLRLELLGNHFGWVIDGKRVSYRPESDLQAELLRTALEHPALRVAVRRGDAAAVILLGAIGGMANAEVWSEFADPILHMTGWNDFISRFTLDVYERVETTGAGRVPQALVVGPWEHDGYWSSTSTGSGDEEFGAASAMGSNRLVDLSLDWFDRWLTGDDTVAAGRPVRLFTMGENAWNEYDQWPPAGVVYQRWYLDSGDGAASLDGDGRLSPARPGSGTDTGEVPELASEFRAVTQTVHHSFDYPSHIVLPVFRPD